MTAPAVAAAGCLVGAAGLLCWPAVRRRPRGRLTAVAGTRDTPPERRTGAGPTGAAGPGGDAHDALADRVDGLPARRVGRIAATSAAAALRPWRWVVGGAGGAALAAVILAGPVAALVAAVYAGLAVRGWLRREQARVRAEAHARTVDGLCALAADLRAGLPAAGRLPTDRSRIGQLTTAAWRLAEATGAPVADLVERIEADARAADRSRASAAAQAAGARATAWLLAALPLGGIALGYGIGADPLEVLLHTPVGAGCTAGALLLQLAGLAWADRLAGGPREALG